MNVTLPIILMMIVLSCNAERFTKDHKELLDKVSKFMQSHPRAVRYSETREERSERINNGLENIVTFFNVVGQLDNFISEKAKTVIKTLNAIYNVNSDDDQLCVNCHNDY
ncbi:uncharacterized protein [Chelonus insularis]|uniref:uncharacterized protein n=1 Tax=Chelonus insularis TaxID=460826 RepID=UPI00158C36A8|nr:uncharacterized protein LOC118066273 [Chelonus insularis]